MKPHVRTKLLYEECVQMPAFLLIGSTGDAVARRFLFPRREVCSSRSPRFTPIQLPLKPHHAKLVETHHKNALQSCLPKFCGVFAWTPLTANKS